MPGQGFLDASLGNNYLKCLRWPSSGIAHLTRREISHELTVISCGFLYVRTMWRKRLGIIWSYAQKDQIQTREREA